MSPLLQSNSSPASELPFLILFPLCLILREALSLCLKCMIYFQGSQHFGHGCFQMSWELYCILAHVFNSVCRQCHEVWASQFPFLHSLREVIPPIEACLYGHINWSLVKAQQQSFMGLSQSFPFKRGGKARPQTGFNFRVQKRSVPGSVSGSSGQPLARRPHLETGNRAHPSGKKSAGGSVSTSSADPRRKGVHGGQHS